jgi:hypothetical protein
MGQTLLWIERLPEGALDAATLFHSRDLPLAREALRDTDAIALIFAAAPFNHRGWRLAAVRDLAREAAPKRVNGVTGDASQAIAETVAWLERAAGITGQLLTVDGNAGGKD